MCESVWDVRFVCCVLLCMVVCVSLCVVLLDLRHHLRKLDLTDG